MQTNPVDRQEQIIFDILHDNLGGDINRLRLRDVASKITNATVAKQGAPVATVIKCGAERQWMSENLGSLPDGMYPLYLAQGSGTPSRDLSASALMKLWEQAEKEATPTMPAPFQFARLLLNPEVVV